jgi:hypothetical protein
VSEHLRGTKSEARLPPLEFALALLALTPAPIGGPVTRPELGVPGGLACPTAFANGQFGVIALPAPMLHPLLLDIQAQREGLTPLHISRIYAVRGAEGLAPPFALSAVPVLPPEWRERTFPAATALYRRVLTRVQRTNRAAAMEMPASFQAMERWELARAVTELFTGLPPDEEGDPRPGLLESTLAWLDSEGVQVRAEDLIARGLTNREPSA